MLILSCGCAANSKVSSRDGTKYNPPIDGCAIHDCITPAKIQPSIENRQAKCCCGKTESSTKRLAFFEYRGPESRAATELCKCGYTASAHTDEIRFKNIPVCESFIAAGSAEFDKFYCGHNGWD